MPDDIAKFSTHHKVQVGIAGRLQAEGVENRMRPEYYDKNYKARCRRNNYCRVPSLCMSR